jgi:hypothetical protein
MVSLLSSGQWIPPNFRGKTLRVFLNPEKLFEKSVIRSLVPTPSAYASTEEGETF